MPRKPLPHNATPLQRLGRFAFMGYEILAWMLVGGLAGFGLDWLLGPRPWLMVVGLMLGLAIGMGRFVRDAMRLTNESKPRGEK